MDLISKSVLYACRGGGVVLVGYVASADSHCKSVSVFWIRRSLDHEQTMGTVRFILSVFQSDLVSTTPQLSDAGFELIDRLVRKSQ